MDYSGGNRLVPLLSESRSMNDEDDSVSGGGDGANDNHDDEEALIRGGDNVEHSSSGGNSEVPPTKRGKKERSGGVMIDIGDGRVVNPSDDVEYTDRSNWNATLTAPIDDFSLPSYTQRRGSKWFPDLSADESHSMKLELAVVYLRDAVHARMPNLRIQYRGEWENYTPLRVYKLVHRNRYRLSVLSIIGVLFALTIWETPSTHTFDNHTLVCALIEFVCLCLLLGDAILRWYSHDQESPYVNRWVRIRWILLVLSLVECLIAICIAGAGVESYRLWRVTRAYFLVEKGRQMRQVAVGILETIPRIMNVCMLIALYVMFFGFGGFLLFSHKSMSWASNRNFNTLEDSFLSLLILLTTANYPDVMMDSYSKNNWSAIYFICFLAFGLYFLFNLVLAVVYSNFHDGTKRVTRKLMLGQKAALCAAFDVIALGEGEALEKRYVDWESFRDVYQLARGSEAYFVAPLVFYALDTDRTGKLKLNQWERIVDFIDLKFSRVKSTTRYGPLPPNASHAMKFTYFRRKLRQFFRNSWVELSFDALVFVNAICIVVMLDLSKNTSSSMIGSMSYGDANTLFLSIFIVEAVLKITAWGAYRYFSLIFNRVDFIVVTMGLLGLLLPGVSALQNFTLFRMLRLIRIIRSFRRFHPYFYTMRQITPALMALTGVLFCTYYAFAILGMHVFGGVITRDKEDQFREQLMKTGWIQQNYWENNFNDISHALVTLWELMVVNNWFIIMNSYALCTSRFARLYFVAFFFCTVMVVMNCVVAFIVEAFTAQYALLQSGRQAQHADTIRGYAVELIEGRERVEKCGPTSDDYFLLKTDCVRQFYEEHRFNYKQTIANWLIKQRRRTPQMYMSMFEGDLAEEVSGYMKKMWEREVDLKSQMSSNRQAITMDRLTSRKGVNPLSFMKKENDKVRLIVHEMPRLNSDYNLTAIDEDHDDVDSDDDNTSPAPPVVTLDANY